MSKTFPTVEQIRAHADAHTYYRPSYGTKWGLWFLRSTLYGVNLMPIIVAITDEWGGNGPSCYVEHLSIPVVPDEFMGDAEATSWERLDADGRSLPREV